MPQSLVSLALPPPPPTRGLADPRSTPSPGHRAACVYLLPPCAASPAREAPLPSPQAPPCRQPAAGASRQNVRRASAAHCSRVNATLLPTAYSYLISAPDYLSNSAACRDLLSQRSSSRPIRLPPRRHALPVPCRGLPGGCTLGRIQPRPRHRSVSASRPPAFLLSEAFPDPPSLQQTLACLTSYLPFLRCINLLGYCSLADDLRSPCLPPAQPSKLHQSGGPGGSPHRHVLAAEHRAGLGGHWVKSR